MDDIFAPPSQIVATPALAGPTMIPAPPLSVPAATPPGKKPSPQLVRRSFRRSFLDRKDPFESAGRQMWKFTFSSSYDLDRQPPEPVAEEIRERLNEQLLDGNLADAQLQVIDFDDASISEEAPRRFVVTSTNTRRHTLVTVNTYLQAYGDHLYYSVRSYILPDLSLWKLLLAIITGGLAFALSGFVPMGRLAFLLAACTYLRRFISDLLAGDTLRLALRKQFPGRVDSGSFDDDDATAFLKTNVSLTLRTVAEVLERYGIDVEGLRMTIQRLEVINVNTGGGSIIGAAIGGIANRIAAEVRS
jgi:hypothetical protein